MATSTDLDGSVSVGFFHRILTTKRELIIEADKGKLIWEIIRSQFKDAYRI